MFPVIANVRQVARNIGDGGRWSRDQLSVLHQVIPQYSHVLAISKRRNEVRSQPLGVKVRERAQIDLVRGHRCSNKSIQCQPLDFVSTLSVVDDQVSEVI